jgi:diguanylate cyclase (GGDEF)-like protein/PAS domain S-box-containing protein
MARALTPPPDRLGRVRWLFTAFTVATAGLMLAVVAVQTHPWPLQVAAGACLAGLALKWVWEYRAGTSWMGTDLIEAAAIVVIAAALAQPLVLLILLYARLCAVAMSASVGRAAVATGLYLVDYAAAIIFGVQAGHPWGVEYVFFGAGFPLAAAVMHSLGATLNESGFRLLFINNPQPMWVYDVDSLRFLEVNQSATEHYGYQRDEFLSMRITDIRPAEDVQKLIQDIRATRPLLQRSGIWRHRLKDGRIITVEVTSHRLTFAGRDAALVAIQDVTAREALDEQLRHQTFHDPLTGLANRALFTERVDHALTRSTAAPGAAVLFLDLDNFKVINDSLGHGAGDELLQQAGMRLLALSRADDTVGRLSGDEFAILLDGVPDLRDAVRVAERVLSSLREPFVLHGDEWFVSASVGLASGAEVNSADELVRNAELAMYATKAREKDSFGIFQPGMHQAILDRLALEQDLRQAVARGELSLAYQPQFETGSRRIFAVEALVRWTHPTRGPVSPMEFIPLAEDTGIIEELGTWVLGTACRQIRAWLDQGMRFVVAINFSGRELGRPGLAERVAASLEENGVPPNCLEVEVTESAAVSVENALPTLLALHNLGVRIAVDDFGVGYSMLHRLQQFPISKLKIDRSFIKEITFGEDEAPLISGIIAIGHSLGLQVVAEGVETTEQLVFLRRRGCDGVQGYLLGRPTEAARITELARTEEAAQRTAS